MNNPLHAKHYADSASSHSAQIIERRELAHETFLIRIRCPEIASRILPGQFVMVRQPQSAEPLLGRAFALYDVVNNAQGDPESIDIVFHIVGKLTSRLATMSSGDAIDIWGPLGNGFSPAPCEHLVMVAGGIGQTPFLAVAKEQLKGIQFGPNVLSRPEATKVAKAKKVTLCYGAREQRYLAGVGDFQEIGVDVHIATDDGTQGHHGRVTELLQQVLEQAKFAKNKTRVICCGPVKMMEATSQVCLEQDVNCQVSLETPMACGIGICFSCVTKVKQSDGSWDFKRTCVDGPIFDARQMIW